MRKGRRLAFIIAILCMIIGGCLAGAGFAIGGRYHDGFGIHLNDFGWNIHDAARSTHTEKIISEDSFQQIYIDLHVGDIEIRRGSTYQVLVKNIPDEDYEFSIKDGKLSLATHDFDLSHLSFGSLEYKVTLVIPEDAAFERIELFSNMGDVDIEDVQSSYLMVEQKMGDVDISDTIIDGDMEIEQKMGDVKFEGEVSGMTTIHNAMGDIKMKLAYLDAYDLKTSMGGIKVNNESESDGMGGHIKSGDQGTKNILIAKNSMGDIKLEYKK